MDMFFQFVDNFVSFFLNFFNIFLGLEKKLNYKNYKVYILLKTLKLKAKNFFFHF